MTYLPAKLTWTHIESLCHHIAGVCITQDFKPDVVVGIARGGLIPAVMIAHELGIRRIRSLQLESYHDDDASQQPIKCLEDARILAYHFERGNALIVDDICDTGTTIEWLRNHFEFDSCHHKIATIALKGYKTPRDFWPDIWGWKYSEPTWIVFPWEPPDREVEILF